MSKPLRIAAVVEGPTDYVVLQAVVKALLPERETQFTYLFPKMSEVFQQIPGDLGLGWAGVYRWCHQTAKVGGGSVSGSFLFDNHDILLVHLDADVADKTYESGHIDDYTDDLPCRQPCPPPSATTNALRQVILRWMNEPAVPDRCVLCIPSKSMETWVVLALSPKSREVRKATWECQEDPEKQLGQQPIKNPDQKNRPRLPIQVFRSRCGLERCLPKTD